MFDVREILSSIGYTNISQMGDYLRMKPIYRAANSAAPLSVNKKTGFFVDFGTSETGNFNKLIMLSLDCSEEEAKKLTQSEYNYTEPVERRMEDIPLVLNSEEIKILLPAYQYFNKRGISTETLQHYKSGLATQGKMSDRFTFPIINKKGQLVGLCGRDVTNYKAAKWKCYGQKLAQWDYPYFFNKQELESSNSVILLEGISDMLALHEADIKNTLVLFGLTMGKALLSVLLSLNPSQILICTNNDESKPDGSTPGFDAAKKISTQLAKWFSSENIKICLPPKKDFGEMSKTSIVEFFDGKLK